MMTALHSRFPTPWRWVAALSVLALPHIAAAAERRPVAASPSATAEPTDATDAADDSAATAATPADVPRSRTINHADESIYVVQQRAFSKKKKFEITPLFYSALNPKFVGYVGGALAVAYHVRENFAIELSSSLPYVNQTYFSNLVLDVHENEGLTPEEVDLKHMSYFGAASLQLSALYGKFRLKLLSFSTLVDYDAYVTAGVGVASTLETCKPNRDGCSELVGAGRGLKSPEAMSDRWKVSANLGGGMRFFFSDMVGLRLEVRDVAYADRDVEEGKQNVTTDIRNNLLLFLGLSVLI